MMDVDESAYSSSELFAAVTRTGVSVYIAGIVHLTVHNAGGPASVQRHACSYVCIPEICDLWP